MKNRIPSSILHRLTTLMLLWAMVLLNADILSGQTLSRDLDKEVLVYILPDSLELPTEIRDITTIDRVTIRSNALAEAMDELSITEIARSFPYWAADNSVRVREDGRVIQRPGFDRVFTIFLPANQSAEEVIERLELLPSVLYAEKHMDASLTNDPQYAAQWHLNNTGQTGGTSGADISAEQAWQIFTGSSDIKIGIFDSGVDLSHNEFTGKISGDHISSTGTEFNWSHGTHVAGIAAARANNSHSGRGVDWNAQIVSKQIFNGHGNFLGNTTVVNKIMDV